MSGSTMQHSNLERVLDCTTPIVPTKSVSKDLSCHCGQAAEKDMMNCFTLEDLWQCYDEWSAYGAGVPITLSSGETVYQYYVPYLSALQIYTRKAIVPVRSPRADSDTGDFETDSWSDSDSDKLSRSLSNNSSRWDAASDESSFEQEGWWPMRERLGDLYCQYIERCSPYGRIPLVDKINELAASYPGVVTFKSNELSPASWMAVAWYPIYHIPGTSIVKDLSACFLTYHTLSSSYQGPQDAFHADISLTEDEDCSVPEQAIPSARCEGDVKSDGEGISLLPFGLATHKMQGDVWVNSERGDHESVLSLFSAADSWLKQLRVQHHDFNYFITRSV